jgi:hypothetical protein
MLKKSTPGSNPTIASYIAFKHNKYIAECVFQPLISFSALQNTQSYFMSMQQSWHWQQGSGMLFLYTVQGWQGHEQDKFLFEQWDLLGWVHFNGRLVHPNLKPLSADIVGRVARFFLMQCTKLGKINQTTPKNTKWS